MNLSELVLSQVHSYKQNTNMMKVMRDITYMYPHISFSEVQSMIHELVGTGELHMEKDLTIS